MLAEVVLKWHQYLLGHFLSSEQTIKVEPWRSMVNYTLVKRDQLNNNCTSWRGVEQSLTQEAHC